ncbi:MAG: hypothetical protein Q8911_00115 [Bacillota bacterium]|nr:hypothetical protein [Bacillota bacterium]
MDEIIKELQEVELSKAQRFLIILAIILVVLANSNPNITGYALHFYGDAAAKTSANVTDLYFATLFQDNGSVTLGIFDNFIRIK